MDLLRRTWRALLPVAVRHEIHRALGLIRNTPGLIRTTPGLIVETLALRGYARGLIPPGVRQKLRKALQSNPEQPTPKAFRRLLAHSRPVQSENSGLLVTCCGGLYAGGAERQVVNTLIGLSERGLRDKLLLLAHRLTPNRPEGFDFYLPMLREANIEAREIIVQENRHLDVTCGLPAPMHQALRHLPMSMTVDVGDHYREFLALRPAVVHAWLDWSNVRAGIAAILAGVPKIILSGRNINPTHFPFHTPYLKPAYQALMEHERIIFLNNSEAGAADYADWLGVPRRRFGILRNGVDFSAHARPTPQAVQAFRASLGIPAGAPVVGGLFRFSPEKRPDVWIESAACIAARHPECRFLLFGTGPLRDGAVALAQARGLGERLTVRDVTRSPLLALASFDVCLLTSAAEGTPNVVLEAQWVGTPVVATAGGGTAEAIDIGASGWIVDEPVPTAIAEAVLRVLSDANLKAVAAQRGPAFVASRFGLERMIRETLDLYGNAASQCPQPAKIEV